jgi:hypothetical protein
VLWLSHFTGQFKKQGREHEFTEKTYHSYSRQDEFGKTAKQTSRDYKWGCNDCSCLAQSY